MGPKVTADTVLERFRERIEAKLREWDPEMVFMPDQEYEWYGTVDKADFHFSIAEAETYGEEGGFNFLATFTLEGGYILGQITPYNFTPRVWTRSLKELERRWDEWFEPVSRADILAMVKGRR